MSQTNSSIGSPANCSNEEAAYNEVDGDNFTLIDDYGALFKFVCAVVSWSLNEEEC